MSPVQQRRCGVAARFLVAAMIAPSAVAAQQSVTDRFSLRVDHRVENQSRGFGSWQASPDDGLDLGVVMSVAYDDNIFLSDSGAEDDLVTRVAPRVAYSAGNADGGTGAMIRVAYQPSAVIYADHSDENRIDHQLAWQAAWRGRALALTGAGYFRRTGDATADLGRQTDRSETGNEVRFTWTPREKLGVELGAGQQLTRYDDSTLYDSKGRYGEIGLVYQHSPKTRLSLRQRSGIFEVEGAGDQKVHRTSARLEWQPREKILVDLEAGFEHREFDNGSTTEPVIEGRIAWQPDASTEWRASVYRRTEASGFYPGQNYDAFGGMLGWSKRMGERWTASLEGGLETASYSRVSGVGPSGRDDKIAYVKPSVVCRIDDRSSLGLFYRYARNQSNEPGFGYENHSLGVEYQSKF